MWYLPDLVQRNRFRQSIHSLFSFLQVSLFIHPTSKHEDHIYLIVILSVDYAEALGLGQWFQF